MLEVATANMAFHQSTKQKGNNSFSESKGDYIVPSFITTDCLIISAPSGIIILTENIQQKVSGWFVFIKKILLNIQQMQEEKKSYNDECTNELREIIKKILRIFFFFYKNIWQNSMKQN